MSGAIAGPPGAASSAASMPRAPSMEQMRELGQILSLLHTSPPRTVFADQDRAWRAVIAARELHRMALWGIQGDGKDALRSEAQGTRVVDSAIQLITILLDAAERLRRDGDMEDAGGLLCDAVRYAQSARLTVPFLQGVGEDDKGLQLSRLYKAEAEVCMRLALLVVPARDLAGQLIGLQGAYELIQDASLAEANSKAGDWQASQMIGLVSEAIATALGWQQSPQRVTTSILEGIRHRCVYDEEGNALEAPADIAVRQPLATDDRELAARLSARKDLIVRFGNLGDAFVSEDDACLPLGAGVVFQCWLPCIEAFVTPAGPVRLRSQDHGPEEYMIRELYPDNGPIRRPVDLVRLDSSQELQAVLRMLCCNVASAGLADVQSARCVQGLNALLRLVLGEGSVLPVPKDAEAAATPPDVCVG